MTMGIVNAGMMGVYSELSTELRERVEDVVLNRRADATERMIEIAGTLKAGGKKEEQNLEWRSASVQQRLAHAARRPDGGHGPAQRGQGRAEGGSPAGVGARARTAPAVR